MLRNEADEPSPRAPRVPTAGRRPFPPPPPIPAPGGAPAPPPGVVPGPGTHRQFMQNPAVPVQEGGGRGLTRAEFQAMAAKQKATAVAKKATPGIPTGTPSGAPPAVPAPPGGAVAPPPTPPVATPSTGAVLTPGSFPTPPAIPGAVPAPAAAPGGNPAWARNQQGGALPAPPAIPGAPAAAPGRAPGAMTAPPAPGALPPPPVIPGGRPAPVAPPGQGAKSQGAKSQGAKSKQAAQANPPAALPGVADASSVPAMVNATNAAGADPYLTQQVNRLNSRFTNDPTKQAVEHSTLGIMDAAALGAADLKGQMGSRGVLNSGAGATFLQKRVFDPAQRAAAGAASNIAIERQKQLDALTLGGLDTMKAPSQLGVQNRELAMRQWEGQQADARAKEGLKLQQQQAADQQAAQWLALTQAGYPTGAGGSGGGTSGGSSSSHLL